MNFFFQRQLHSYDGNVIEDRDDLLGALTSLAKFFNDRPTHWDALHVHQLAANGDRQRLEILVNHLPHTDGASLDPLDADDKVFLDRRDPHVITGPSLWLGGGVSTRLVRASDHADFHVVRSLRVASAVPPFREPVESDVVDDLLPRRDGRQPSPSH
jgi:hypothetical protein